VKEASATTASTETPEVKDGDVTCTGGGAGIQNNGEQRPEYYDPGPMPKNVYDRGFVENWKEVIFPMSLRKDALELGGYSRPTRPAQGKPSAAPKAAPSISTSSDKTD